MLSARFAIAPDPESGRFRMLTIRFEGTHSLVVSDPQGLAAIKVNPILSRVPDALEVDGTYLRRKIGERPTVRAKPFLWSK